MRRIADLIRLDGDREPDDVAVEIVETARLRGMLEAVIRQIAEEDWQRLRDVRLRALAQDPAAFLETHANASALPGRAVA